MALPPLTPEQRSAALQRATDARRERAAVKVRLKSSGHSIAEVIASGKENDAIGKMRVSALLESMPGIGRVRLYVLSILLSQPSIRSDLRLGMNSI